MKAARVVVLTVALAAGGVAAMLAGRSGKTPDQKSAATPVATVDVLVAKTDITTGQELSPGDVQWEAWPATASSGNFIRKSDRPNAVNQLTGNIARVPFVAGEPIREAKLVNAKGFGFMAAILPSGMRAIATQISAETSAGGFILPNDHVDVILTRRDKAAEKASGGTEVQVSETILRNVRVLAIDQTLDENGGKKEKKNVVGKTATLELSERQAETLALSQKLGTLSLALRSVADASLDSAPDDAGPDGNTKVNVVRFGVSTTVTPK
jgi:pilus assembly protein CpaB